MEQLKRLLGIGKAYDVFTVLPLTIKEIAEAGSKEFAVLTMNPVWTLDDPDKKLILEKWIERKIRKGDQSVTLNDLIEMDYPMPWLSDMLLMMLEQSGFKSASKE